MVRDIMLNIHAVISTDHWRRNHHGHMKPSMSPQLARQVLKWTGVAVGIGTILVGMWEQGQLNWATAAGAIAAYLTGRAQEAPGGVAVWKLPDDVQASIRPAAPPPVILTNKGE